MYEDNICDENFHTEIVSDFVRDNISSEHDEYIMRTYMKPCNNCGELVSKTNIQPNGMCYLCSMSDKHAEIRGSSSNATSNYSSLEKIVKRWDEE